MNPDIPILNIIFTVVRWTSCCSAVLKRAAANNEVCARGLQLLLSTSLVALDWLFVTKVSLFKIPKVFVLEKVCLTCLKYYTS